MLYYMQNNTTIYQETKTSSLICLTCTSYLWKQPEQGRLNTRGGGEDFAAFTYSKSTYPVSRLSAFGAGMTHLRPLPVYT
jgi:hypothetical protein